MELQVENQLEEETKHVNPDMELTIEDLHLLCDLFYLPFEHGNQGLQLLHEFQWLKTNSNLVAGIAEVDKAKPEVLVFSSYSFNPTLLHGVVSERLRIDFGAHSR